MDKNEIRSILESSLVKQLPLTPRFTAPSRTESGSRFLGSQSHVSLSLEPYVREINKYLECAFSHIQMNPFDLNNRDAFTETYHFSSASGPSTNYVNTETGHRQLLQDIIDFPDNKKYPALLLTGAKGSGKTFYINYLLSSETDNLYVNNRVIIFRLDLSQLYTLHPQVNVENAGPDELNSKDDLLEFLATKTMFTSYIIRDMYPELDEFWKFGKDEIYEILVTSWNRKRQSEKYRSDIFSNTSPDGCYDELKRLFESIIHESHPEKDETYYAESGVFKTLNTRHNGFISLVAFEALIKFLSDRKINALTIIDGVDNIDYYHDKDTYDSTLRLIDEYFIRRHGIDGNNAKVIIALRNESASHLRKISRNFFRKRIKEYSIDENQSILGILQKKLKVATEPVSTYFRDLRKYYVSTAESRLKDLAGYTPENNHISEYFSGFDKFTNYFLDNIFKIFQESKDRHGIEIRDHSDVLKIIYGGNVRSFLFNFLNIYKYERLVVQRNTAIHGRSYYKNTDSSQFVFTEGQLLNGRLYLDTNEEPFQFGKVIPNIFWFNCHKSLDNWHGLCLYRLLQLGSSNGFEKQHLISEIVGLFGYDEDEVASVFEMGMQHGLFFSTYDAFDDDAEVIFRTSEKGRFILSYVLSDLNIIYFLALDTPLSNHAITRSTYLKYHSQSPTNPWEYFPEACVTTSITFLRHILTRHSIESKHRQFDSDVFKLPAKQIDLVLDDMERLVVNQIKRNAGIGEEIISNIEGWLS